MEKYITLAIHTYDFAASLKRALEQNDIPVQLENVDMSQPAPAPGVRVRIPEHSLPKALRLIEQSEALSPSAIRMQFEGVRNKVLVPLDFSQAGYTACKVAFDFAKALGLHPVLMHVFATPYFDGSLSMTDSFTLDVRDAEVRKKMEDAAQYGLKTFCKKIDTQIAGGELANVSYTTHLSEGMPEEEILSFTRQSPPELVVMSTRDAAKRSRELMGSVAAEVLDNCRVPVLTWPADREYRSLGELRKCIFFCNVDQNDLLAMDMLVRLFKSAPLDVTLVPVTEKAGNKLAGRMRALTEYFRSHYPECSFESEIPEIQNLRTSIESITAQKEVSLLVVPNKKKNIFVRLFNPGIAHRVIFETDRPLLALPI